MSKNKRMIYVWDENIEFYDSLPNKSDFMNRQIAIVKEQGKVNLSSADLPTPWEVDQNPQPKLSGIDDPSHPDWHPDPNIRETRKQIAAMEARDKENVRKSRL